MKFIKSITSTIKKAIKENISEKKIALSVSTGITIMLMPIYGLQTILSIVSSRIFKLNTPITLLACYIGNPLTYPFFLALQLVIGEFVLTGAFDISRYSNFNIDKALNLLPALLIGSAISIIIAFPLSYFITLHSVRAVRGRKEDKKSTNDASIK